MDKYQMEVQSDGKDQRLLINYEDGNTLSVGADLVHRLIMDYFSDKEPVECNVVNPVKSNVTSSFRDGYESTGV